MNYDFSGLCADQIEKLEKRLKSLNKSFTKEYVMALVVINHEKTNQNMPEIMVEVNDILNDVSNKCAIFYTEAMNKIQRSLSIHLIDVQ